MVVCVWIKMYIILSVICEIISEGGRKEQVGIKDVYTWKFREVNHMITTGEKELAMMRKELKHFVLFVHVPGLTISKVKLHEMEKLSKEMKKDLHPVPVGLTSDQNIYLSFKIQDGPLYVYYRHGEPIVYKGEKTTSSVREWIYKMRWPNSEPVDSERKLKQTIHHSVVTVVYYGEKNRLEEGYQNYTSQLIKFTHTHMRFLHTFKWEMKRKIVTRLPCIEIFSHMHSEEIENSIICQDLEVDKIYKFLDSHKPISHPIFHPGMIKRWFNHKIVNVMVFIHKGIDSENDRLTHRVFHQFMNHTNFDLKIGEVDVRKVNV